jgi:3-dehydroquinate dehydratase / shikimate dehydrogenase
VELFEIVSRSWPDRALLCVSVADETVAGQVAARERVAPLAALVEMRLDMASDPDPARALAGRSRPVLVTCRARAEGGRFRGTEEERLALLEAALDAGADLVDVEWSASGKDRLLARAPDRVVVSLHDFGGVPADLEARVRAMVASPARFVKVAVATSSMGDLLRLQRLDGLAGGKPRLVIVGMGEAGLPSRVLAARFGSVWTYAGQGIAPGQVSAERLAGELGFDRLGPATRLFGLVGRPVAHSVSPAMHNAAFAAAGLDAVYIPFEAADFEDFQEFAAAFGVEGVSVTSPHKPAALAAAAHAGEDARRTGAANSLRRRPDGRWDACNTDVEGFLAPLAAEPLAGRRVTVLGSGGAARAVVVGLVARGASPTVVARRPERAREVAGLAGVAWAEWPPRPGSWDILVNTTPVGTWPHVEERPLEGEVAGSLVYDLVYNPPETALLRSAREQGLRTIGGFDMLVAQAARQFEWWTGRRAPAAVMREAGLEALQQRRSEA